MSSPPSDARRVSVGIGQFAVAKGTADVLVAYGLGSCVGISCYDPVAKVAGLAHILLPAAEGKRSEYAEPARYADTGIDRLVKEMGALGALPRRTVVKLAGGASVLGPGNAEKFKIGQRNAEAIRDRLKRHGISAAASDLGGTKGRTLELQVATGKTYVRTAASPATEL